MGLAYSFRQLVHYYHGRKHGARVAESYILICSKNGERERETETETERETEHLGIVWAFKTSKLSCSGTLLPARPHTPPTKGHTS